MTLANESSSQSRYALRIAFAVFVLCVGAVLFNVVMALLTQMWQLWFVSGGNALVLAGAAYSYFQLGRRGRYAEAIELILTVLLLGIVWNALWLAQAGMILGLVALIITLIFMNFVRSKSMMPALMGSIIVASTAALLDFWAPPFQIAIVAMEVFVPFITGAALLSFGIVVFRLFKNYTIGIQLTLVLLIVTIVSMSAVMITTTVVTRQSLNQNADRALFAAARQTSNNVQAFLKNQMDSVDISAQLPEFVHYLQTPGSVTDDEIKSMLVTLGRKDRVYISSYALLDVRGQNLLDTYTPGIGRDESAADYYQVPLRTGRPYVSQVVMGENGQRYIYFSAPVRDSVGEAGFGVLRVRYDAGALQQLLVQNKNLAGTDSFPILLDDALIRLADANRADLISQPVGALTAQQISVLQNQNRLPVDFQKTDLPDFAVGLARANSQPYFTAALYPDDLKSNRAAVVNMSAGNATWQVVFAQPYDAFLAPMNAQLRISLLVAVLTGSLVTVVALLIAQYLARPIVHLTATAVRIADGDLNVQAEVESGNEIGSLAIAFNRMTEQVRQMMQGLVQKNSQLEQEMLERERAEAARQQSELEREKLLLAQAELQEKLIEVQRQTLKELSTPIIPIMDRIIVLPLIGTVDNTRAKDLTRAVLNGISHYRARVIILDITGVSSIDSDVADYLNKTIQAARLKGARTIVTGISDSVAETIVDLGIDWSKIETLRDLQSGLVAALQSVGIRVLRKDGKK